MALAKVPESHNSTLGIVVEVDTENYNVRTGAVDDSPKFLRIGSHRDYL
jgi:hypothetical protein